MGTPRANGYAARTDFSYQVNTVAGVSSGARKALPPGYIASKKRYFYGVRVQLLTTKNRIPVEFVFLPGSANDVRALNALPLNLPLGSELYTESVYTNYTAKDDLEQSSQIFIKVMRKKILSAKIRCESNISSNLQRQDKTNR